MILDLTRQDDTLSQIQQTFGHLAQLSFFMMGKQDVMTNFSGLDL